MMLTYRKKTGEVVMIGQAVENKALTSIELPDDIRMTQGYVMKIVKGAIQYEKAWWMGEKEKEDQQKQDFVKDVAELQNAKSVGELRPLLEKMIKKTYNQE